MGVLCEFGAEAPAYPRARFVRSAMPGLPCAWHQKEGQNLDLQPICPHFLCGPTLA